MAELIRIDRNGTKYYQGMIPCDRCDGKGIYYIGVCNDKLIPSWVDQGVCFKCGGLGKVKGKWKEYTPEYAAKLEARRKAKAEKWQQEHAEEIARQEAERKAKEEAEAKAKAEEEARIKAEKAISNYVGQIGDKIDIKAIYEYSAFFNVPSFYNRFQTETIYIHNFKDAKGNKLIWKTGSPIDGNVIEKGMEVSLKGTIKEHKEYKDEKQTILTRCRVKEA